MGVFVARADARREPPGSETPSTSSLDRLDRVTVLLAIACCALVGLNVARGSLSFQPYAQVLVIGMLCLEVACAPIGPFGFFSSSLACAVALALAEGSTTASVSALITLAIRSAVHGRSTRVARLKETLTDLAPGLLAIEVASAARSLPAIVTGVAVMLAYGVLYTALLRRFLTELSRAERMEALPVERGLRFVRLVIPLTGVVLATLPIVSAVSVIALLWVLQALAGNIIYRARAQQIENTRGQLARSFEIYESARDVAESARKELADAKVERGTIEAFARHLASSRTLDATLGLIIEEAGRTVHAQSVCIFVEDEGKLVPALYRCPDLARLEIDAVAGVSEPLVERVWRQRASMRSTKGGSERRLFPDDSQAIALPLQNQGVLYLGRAGSLPYDEEDVAHLLVVAGYGGLALQSTRRFAQREEALRLQAEANEKLEASMAALADANLRLRESQEQLVQSSKLAAVGQLAAGVAHEINTPLGAIQISVELAAARISNDPQKAAKSLDTAVSAVRRARTIIEKLLVYASHGSPKDEDVDVSCVVTEALELVRSRLEQEGVAVSLDLEAREKVRGNDQELQQVVVNLLLNALDASRRDKRPLRVSTFSRGNEVALEVEDQGEGIRSASLSRIFEPFYTEKPIGQGTGLGLAVSRQIVERHGGRFDVRSCVGQGSTFTVWLPVKRSMS